MADSSSSSSGGGIGCVGMLQILFIGLKLAEVGRVAHWSWWLVFSPTLACLAGIAGILLGSALFVIAAYYRGARRG